MENEIQTLKPNSPRWLDCDLDCEGCPDNDSCSLCTFRSGFEPYQA